MSIERRAPRATYRLQLHGGFPLDAASELAGYLSALGVSHVYSSPHLQAAPGSTHGYDVVDPTTVNTELGGLPAHERYCAALDSAGLGQLLDIVPNHMAVTGRENRWWWDVLENGPSSRYAAYFDVDWHPPEERLRNKVLLSVLGDHYGRVLEAGELRVEREGAIFVVRYFDHVFPLAPRSLDVILRGAAERTRSDTLAFLADAHERLPAATATDRAAVQRRHRDKEVMRGLLLHLLEDQSVSQALDDVVASLNAHVDDLDHLLERQNYRLAFWRTARSELSYRRFFDINELVGMRVDDEHVFDDSHALVLDWLRRGVVDGLRVDHVDGLRDPEGYLRRLRAACPPAWIVVEKILEEGEELRESFPVEGTTGYDFLNEVGGLFVDAAGEAPLTAVYQELTGVRASWHELIRQKKELILDVVLGSDLNRLAALFLEVCERHRRHRDYTRGPLRDGLRAVLVCFPVYRTYVAQGAAVADVDRSYIYKAVELARERFPHLDPGLLDLLRSLLLLEVPGELELELALRFQQLSGPVMAKGVEDTALYGYHRLLSLNEVGGDPSRFGLSVQAFHESCRRRQERWPRSLLSTSTHDTKRSEDVRARLSVLSEVPARWAASARRWMTASERHLTDGWPEANTRYLFFQSLVGAWPISEERMSAYMEKASREAKEHTSWTDPEAPYDRALQAFVKGAMGDADLMSDVESFVHEILPYGRIGSLAQTLLKLTCPGVPDLYQGSELWDHSLVDPDNRRPVDFALRRRLLEECRDMSPEDALARMEEGVPKLWLTERVLQARRRHARAFGSDGEYRPLVVIGSGAEHAVAFLRGGEVAVVVPRLLAKLDGEWRDTAVRLPEGRFQNIFDGARYAGGEVPLATAFARFPVALLVAEEVQ